MESKLFHTDNLDHEVRTINSSNLRGASPNVSNSVSPGPWIPGSPVNFSPIPWAPSSPLSSPLPWRIESPIHWSNACESYEVPARSEHWMEFVLNPQELERHLSNPYADPLPHELLRDYLRLSIEIQRDSADLSNLNDRRGFTCTRKQICQKILCFQIVSIWKWNLNELEAKLPVQLSYSFVKDFICVTNDSVDVQNISVLNLHVDLNFDLLTEEQIFSISFFHMWCIDICLKSKTLSKSSLTDATTSWSVGTTNVILSYLVDDAFKNGSVLQKLLDLDREFISVPTFHCFYPPTENADYHTDWGKCIRVPKKYLNCKIVYHLGVYMFYRERYDEAKEYFAFCNTSLNELRNFPDNQLYLEIFKIEESVLKGFSLACGISGVQEKDLTLDFYEDTVFNNYTNILNILQEDNLKREVPLSYRDSVELELSSMLSCGKFTASRDLLLQIQTLNAIRRMVDGASYPTVYDFAMKLNNSRKGGEILFRVLRPQLNATLSEDEVKYIRLFLSTLFDHVEPFIIKEIISWPESKRIFTNSQLVEFNRKLLKSEDADSIITSTVEIRRERTFSRIKSFGNDQLELRWIESVIVDSYKYDELYENITLYLSKVTDRPVNSINKWGIDKSFEGIMKNLPSLFLQQFSFIIFAKVVELIRMQNFTKPQELLQRLDEELKKFPHNMCHKLSQLIMWEMLFVSAVECEYKFKQFNHADLALKCKSCIGTIQQNSDLVPRLEVMEQVIIALLNVCEWEFIVNNTFHKPFRFLETAIEMAQSSIDLQKFKGSKKLPPGLWDKVSSTFLKHTSQWQERERNFLSYVLMKLREPAVINVMLSLLVKLYNVLRDENTAELHFIYLNVWPSTLTSNVSAYNKSAVAELLFDFVKQMLRHYPNYVQWLKLLGDLNYVHLNHTVALQHYLEAAIVCTDYFTRWPPNKPPVEEYIFKRMTRCCEALRCFTQAAILCQFWDDRDNAKAFEYFAQKDTLDSMDEYFELIPDVHVLEFVIATHAKRKEQARTNRLIDIAGNLELNSFNNEEIKREAANVRKCRFLRALAKQYVSKIC